MRAETKRLVALGLLTVLLVLHQFVYVPGRRKLSAVRNMIAQKRKDQEILKDLCSQYLKSGARTDVSHVRYADPGFSLLAFFASTLDTLSLQTSLKGLTPMPLQQRESLRMERIKATLEGIPLEKVCALLQAVETSPGFIYVPAFQMKRNKEKPHLLSVEIELLVLKHG